MKKTILSFVLLISLALVPSLFAAELAPEGTAVSKLQRGFLNVALSPIELSYALAQEKKHDDFIPSWMAGVGRGSFFTLGRALAGVYEMLTAPFPLPAGYEPVVYPELVWDYLPQEESKSTNLKTRNG